MRHVNYVYDYKLLKNQKISVKPEFFQNFAEISCRKIPVCKADGVAAGLMRASCAEPKEEMWRREGGQAECACNADCVC
jgi:hypothetical protein